MKRNKKYVFLTAEELAHRLTYGKRKPMTLLLMTQRASPAVTSRQVGLELI